MKTQNSKHLRRIVSRGGHTEQRALLICLFSFDSNSADYGEVVFSDDGELKFHQVCVQVVQKINKYIYLCISISICIYLYLYLIYLYIDTL